MKKLYFLLLVCIMAACGEAKNNATQEDLLLQTESATDSVKTAEGKVLEIQQGKDGYTAKIQSTDETIYFITISHSNLNDPKQYKSLKIGDQIMVSGDAWKSDDGEQHITVREIL